MNTPRKGLKAARNQQITYARECLASYDASGDTIFRVIARVHIEAARKLSTPKNFPLSEPLPMRYRAIYTGQIFSDNIGPIVGPAILDTESGRAYGRPDYSDMDVADTCRWLNGEHNVLNATYGVGD